MRTSKQAIKVTRVAEGWTWTVIDQEGATAARGEATEQHGAMETAWRAARSFSDGPWNAFPEIIVEQGPSGH